MEARIRSLRKLVTKNVFLKGLCVIWKILYFSLFASAVAIGCLIFVQFLIGTIYFSGKQSEIQYKNAYYVWSEEPKKPIFKRKKTDAETEETVSNDNDDESIGEGGDSD